LVGVGKEKLCPDPPVATRWDPGIRSLPAVFAWFALIGYPFF
jgi:hypothetical protein